MPFNLVAFVARSPRRRRRAAAARFVLASSLTLFATLTSLFCAPPPAAHAQDWQARYNGPDNSGDYARALAVDASGNVYVTGYSSDGATGSDYATIKYNSAGVTCPRFMYQRAS